MHHITKRSIALTLLILWGSSTWSNSYIKPIAIVATAGIAGYYIGPWLYSYLFPLSDQEEIEKTYNKIKKAEILHNDISLAYHNEMAIVANYNPLTSTPKDVDAKVLERLKLEITPKHTKHPFYNYVKNLNVQAQKINDTLNQLSSTRMILAERKLKLYSCNLPADQISFLQGQFDEAIDDIKNSLNSLDELQKKLSAIRSIVIQSTDYILQYQQIRIEELEQRLYASESYNYSHDYSWSRPCQTTYVTTPAQPQVTVNNYNTCSPSCSQTNTTQTSSAPAQTACCQANYTAKDESTNSSSHNAPTAEIVECESPTMAFDPELWCSDSTALLYS